MADLSAITSVTVVARTVFGNKRIVMGYVTLGDGSKTVPSAGLAVTAAQLGLGAVESIMFSNKLYPYDWASGVLYSGTGANIPASGDKVYFFAVGYGG